MTARKEGLFLPPKSQQQREAADKYLKEKVDTIAVRVPKGKKDIIRDIAEAQGESVNAYINKAIDQRMEREDKAENEPI